MMFPIGTGRRKSDLLPHRAHAVALIWKMISVLLEPINIILVSPVNDTFLPSIVDLTEEEMRFRGRTREEEEERKRGGILQGLAYSKGVLHPSNCFLTSKTFFTLFLIHTRTHSEIQTANHPTNHSGA